MRRWMTPLVVLLCGCTLERQHIAARILPTTTAHTGSRPAAAPDTRRDAASPIAATDTDASALTSVDPPRPPDVREARAEQPHATGEEIQPAALQQSSEDVLLALDAVIASVYESYPLLAAALLARNVADGDLLAAWGEFDLKLKAASENGPTGFYQTYRQSIGLVQPLYNGSEVFAGYRIGRGDFQPWYLERQTNDGGEFKAGFAVPLARNREIDARRAALWRSDYGRQLVEPEIQAQLIGFVQEASYAYWDWVAAGAKLRIADRVLGLAEERTERIRRQVQEGLLDPPELTDNLRLVAERRAKRAEAARKLQESAVKLSLYHRNAAGVPQVPAPQALPDFPPPQPVNLENVPFDVEQALNQRPEIAVLNAIQRQLDVDYAEAENQLLAAVDVVMAASQDVGEPTSKKNDKGEFELEASLFFDLPIQRRKARGKMQAVQGKIAQLRSKRLMVEDKIVADVQLAYAGLLASLEQVHQAREAVRLAEDLAQRERRNFELGASDLLKVTLREQYAAESAEKAVDALLIYYRAQADYRAALAQDRLP